MPTHLLVDQGAQGHGLGHGAGRGRGVGGGVPLLEVAEDHHHLALGKVGPVGGGIGREVAAIGGDVGEGTQPFGHAGQLGGHLQIVIFGDAEDAR
ncbi:hypothetical protein D3C79_568950 [compost metagenome]